MTKESRSPAGYKGENEIVWGGVAKDVDDFSGASDASLVGEGVSSSEYFDIGYCEVVWFVVGDNYPFMD